MLLQIKNLTFKYDDSKNIINDISFSIPKGSITAIIGHNGSGKSTLAKLILALLEPTSGEIIYDNITLSKKTISKIRTKIGILFQNPDNQFIGANCKYDIAFGLENECLDANLISAKVSQIAKKLNLEHIMKKMPHELSGGQKQRVALAGLLALNKELLIFDEATSMLDYNHKKEIMDLIIKLNKEENKTIILITHDLNEALFSDNIIILKEGKIIKSGTPKEILTNKELLESSNLYLPDYLNILNNLNDSKYNQERIKEKIWQLALKR